MIPCNDRKSLCIQLLTHNISASYAESLYWSTLFQAFHTRAIAAHLCCSVCDDVLDVSYSQSTQWLPTAYYAQRQALMQRFSHRHIFVKPQTHTHTNMFHWSLHFALMKRRSCYLCDEKTKNTHLSNILAVCNYSKQFSHQLTVCLPSNGNFQSLMLSPVHFSSTTRKR